MTYKWNGDRLGAVFALPAAVVDSSLRMAGATQLKVLLWFARQGQFDAEACSAAIGVSAADCRDAMQFWTETGLLLAEGEVAFAPVPAPAPVLPVLPVEPKRRPGLPEVIQKQKTCGDFDYLLKTAEGRLGRPITPGEMESFLYIYDTVGLPAEVILMILVDAVNKDKVRVKSSFRSYLEKVALTWAEQGITTVPAAELELCRQENRRKTGEHIRTLFGLSRPLTLLQLENAMRWEEEFRFGDDILLVALAKCKEKTDTVNVNYIHKVLEGWYTEGIATVEQAKAAGAVKKKSNAKPLLSDDSTPADSGDAYEQMAADWRPVYKKPKKDGV
ncbi:MAG: DnaD domain protein [Clostridia bacterium]|nr:DnaD domain protein [Clostridia bacterium]